MSTIGAIPSFPSIGQICVVSKEKEVSVQWKIKNIFTVWDQSTPSCKWSPEFKFEGVLWHIRLLPNGNKSNYLSLGLFKCTYTAPVYVEFSFSLKNLGGLKEYEKCHAEVFEGWCVNPIVVDSIVSRSDLLKRHSEFLDSEQFLTVICTLKRLKCIGANITAIPFPLKLNQDANKIFPFERKFLDTPVKNENVTAVCSYCKQNFDSNEILCHANKCLDKPIKCSECSEVVRLQNWFYHECHKVNVKECSYCKKLVDQKKISCHENYCKMSPIQCPQCSAVILLQNWNDHTCPNE